MNERIETLAKAAGYDMINKAAMRALGFDVEKFAELIVEECINEIAYIGKANEVFGDRTDGGGLNHILWTTETAIEKIREHFGVEE
jgi:hypothetical protein